MSMPSPWEAKLSQKLMILDTSEFKWFLINQLMRLVKVGSNLSTLVILKIHIRELPHRRTSSTYSPMLPKNFTRISGIPSLCPLISPQKEKKITVLPNFELHSWFQPLFSRRRFIIQCGKLRPSFSALPSGWVSSSSGLPACQVNAKKKKKKHRKRQRGMCNGSGMFDAELCDLETQPWHSKFTSRIT